ncbi:hypothetical protein M8J76_012387 [Diaphorina citri]|nr:hypothetical protein M8J76_012387 [Diaphorina citri]
MSEENLNGNNAEDDNIGDEPNPPRVPLQPDIGLGLERSNNETRRNHNIEPPSGSGGSVSFSHFLGRAPGASNSGLPDFVQDHLADIPFNLNQSRSSCDNGNPTLPDFLSDTQRSVNPPEPSSSSSSNNLLQIENNNLRRELDNLRRLLAQQLTLILRLENQIQEQSSDASSPSQSVSSSHSQALSSLQQEVETLRQENRLLKQRRGGGSVSNVRSTRLSQELRNQATQSENLLRGLMNSVSSMKDLANQLAAETSADPGPSDEQEYRDLPSDSEDD